MPLSLWQPAPCTAALAFTALPPPTSPQLHPAFVKWLLALPRAFPPDQTFFSNALAAVGGTTAGPGMCVVNVYVNYEKKFAFVEMRTGAAWAALGWTWPLVMPREMAACSCGQLLCLAPTSNDAFSGVQRLTPPGP